MYLSLFSKLGYFCDILHNYFTFHLPEFGQQPLSLKKAVSCDISGYSPTGGGQLLMDTSEKLFRDRDEDWTLNPFDLDLFGAFAAGVFLTFTTFYRAHKCYMTLIDSTCRLSKEVMFVTKPSISHEISSTSAYY